MWMSRTTLIQYLDCSEVFLCDLVRTGQFPEPVRLPGNSPRWHADDIEDWMDAGCPVIDKERHDTATPLNVRSVS